MTMTGIGLPASSAKSAPIASDPSRIRIATMLARGGSAVSWLRREVIKAMVILPSGDAPASPRPHRRC
jgi:hypothetical protein